MDSSLIPYNLYGHGPTPQGKPKPKPKPKRNRGRPCRHCTRYVPVGKCSDFCDGRCVRAHYLRTGSNPIAEAVDQDPSHDVALPLEDGGLMIRNFQNSA